MCSSDLPNPKPQTPNPKPQTPNPDFKNAFKIQRYATLYFPYCRLTDQVDTSSFKAEYSQGKITEQDIMALVNEPKNIPFPQNLVCFSICWLVLATFVVVGAGLCLFLLGSSVSLTASEAGLGGGLIGGPGFVLFITIAIMACCGNSKNTDLRNKTISEIFQKHQSQVFGPKQATLNTSLYGTYLIIQFEWPRAAQPQPRANQQMMPMGY